MAEVYFFRRYTLLDLKAAACTSDQRAADVYCETYKIRRLTTTIFVERASDPHDVLPRTPTPAPYITF